MTRPMKIEPGPMPPPARPRPGPCHLSPAFRLLPLVFCPFPPAFPLLLLALWLPALSPFVSTATAADASPPPATESASSTTATTTAAPPVASAQAGANPPGGPAFSSPDWLSFTGFIETTGALDLEHDQDYEQARTLRNRARLEAKANVAAGPKTAAPGAIKNASYFLVSVESDYLGFADSPGYDDYDLDLYEAYFHYSRGPVELRLGKQMVRWGKTDQLSPLDVLNPQDLRLLMLPTLEERKIPQWMARLRLFREAFTLEGVAIPWFEPDDIDYFGTDWALFRHSKSVLLDAPLPEQAAAAVRELGVSKDQPAVTWGNMQWGLRAATTLGAWDLALSGFDGFNPYPYFRSFPVTGISVKGSFDPDDILENLGSGVPTGGDVAVTYKRTQMVGLEWETVLGAFGFRGEVAYSSRTPFLTDDLTSVTAPTLFSVIGLDHTGAADWYANLQLGHQVLLDYDDRVLYFNQHNLSLNGELSKGFLRGDLQARLRWMQMLTDGGGTWNPALIYRGFPAWTVTLGLNLFGGPSDTWLGSYSGNDQAYVTVKYVF